MLAPVAADRAGKPHTSSSLADEKHVGSFLLSTAARAPLKNELMPILPAERDPRLITIRRGGTLTDQHHRLLAEWAALCAEHVLHLFEQEQPRDTRPRDAHRAAFWRMLPHVDCPTRRSSRLLRPGKQWRWPTSQPTTWELRHTPSGQPLLPLSPVRQRQHASGNETGSEKEFPQRFES